MSIPYGQSDPYSRILNEFVQEQIGGETTEGGGMIEWMATPRREDSLERDLLVS